MQRIHVSYEQIHGKCIELKLGDLPKDQRRSVFRRATLTKSGVVCYPKADGHSRIHFFEGNDLTDFSKRLKVLTPPKEGEFIVQLVERAQPAPLVAVG